LSTPLLPTGHPQGRLFSEALVVAVVAAAASWGASHLPLVATLPLAAQLLTALGAAGTGTLSVLSLWPRGSFMTTPRATGF